MKVVQSKRKIQGIISLLTIVSDWFRSPLITSVIITLLVLGLPCVIDLQTTVELLSAGRQQLNVCPHSMTPVSTQINDWNVWWQHGERDIQVWLPSYADWSQEIFSTSVICFFKTKSSSGQVKCDITSLKMTNSIYIQMKCIILHLLKRGT